MSPSNKSNDGELPNRDQLPRYLVQLRQIYSKVNSGSKSFGNWNGIEFGRKKEN